GVTAITRGLSPLGESGGSGIGVSERGRDLGQAIFLAAGISRRSETGGRFQKRGQIGFAEDRPVVTGKFRRQNLDGAGLRRGRTIGGGGRSGFVLFGHVPRPQASACSGAARADPEPPGPPSEGCSPRRSCCRSTSMRISCVFRAFSTSTSADRSWNEASVLPKSPSSDWYPSPASACFSRRSRID